MMPPMAKGKAIHAESSRARSDGAPIDPVVALLGRQLASGMWDDPSLPGSVSEREVRATALALIELLERGVTTAHALHGAQVKKAVDALLARVSSVDPRTAELALAVAWLVASGPRTRKLIEHLVSTEPELSPLRGRLEEATLRADIGRLASR